jgi:hypothetical protein
MNRLENQLYGALSAMEKKISKCRRNADGQQNLIDLRKALAASPHSVHNQGGTWIMSQWSESHNAYVETPAPYWMSERQAIQTVLFGEAESPDEAKYHADRHLPQPKEPKQ